MKKQYRVAAAVASFAGCVSLAQAQQTPAIHKKHAVTHRKTVQKAPSLAEEVRSMRLQLQAEIDELKASLAAKDAQISALEQRNANAQQAVVTAEAQSQATAAQVQTLNSAVQGNTDAVTGVQSSVSNLQSQSSSVATNVEQIQKTTDKIQKSIDQPTAFHYKGVTITPGGFLAAEAVRRSRALNSDIYTNYNAIPYPGADEAHVSEFVPTARQSRLSALVSGKVPFGTLNGYVEGDFLSAGSSSNNLQTNSYPFRVRQAWGQVVIGGFKFTGGQMWTLLTEDKKSTDAGQEAVPLTFDNNAHVGFTWLRQPGYRFQESFTPKVTLAVSLENSQYQFSASNAPTNFFFGNPGAAAGLNNPDANYTDQVAPDVISKLSFDPGYGHYEIGGIARFFRDRYYPNASSTNAQNNTKVGGGFIASARFPLAKKVDVGFHVTAGDGTGRYGASLLPDITVHPDGTLALIHNAQGLFTLEGHPTKRLDLFLYGGTEYDQRTVYRNAAGVLVGYAPPTANNAGCFTEAVPTSGTGYAPAAAGSCLGATRDIVEGTVGYVYRIYQGPAGKVQYGLQYSYISREGWAGVGGAPKATENQFYTSFRYYIP